MLATNTFNANAISQSDYGDDAAALVGDINREAARITRAVADEFGGRWVAGALGPTNKTLSLSPDVNDPGFREVTFAEVKAVYRQQVEALAEGGVDLILIETVFDTLNAKAAIMAVLEAERALGRRAADDAVDDPDRSERPQPLRPYGRGVLGQRPPCPAADHRPQLLVRGAAIAAAPVRAGRGRPTRW